MPNYIPPAGSGGSGAVSSVAGRTGDVVLVVGDVSGAAPAASPAFSGTATFVSSNIERGFVLGKAGAIGATETNAADVPFISPYAATMKRLKVVLQTAASGAMVVQLRKAAAPGTAAPSYADVSGFAVTFANGSTIATATPGTAVAVSEGDLLNFSASTGSGVGLALEVVAVV